MKKFISSVLTASLLATSIAGLSVPDTAAAQKTDSAETGESDLVTDLSKYETNEIIVGYKKEANATAEKTFRIASLSKAEQEQAEVSSLTDSSVMLTVDSEEALADAVEALSEDARVAYVQPNYQYHVTQDAGEALENLKSNPDFAQQWAYYNDGSLKYSEPDYRSGSGNFWDWFPGFFSLETQKSVAAQDSDSETIEVTAKDDVDIDLEEAWANCTATGNRETVVAIVDTGVMYDHEDLADSMWTNPGEIAGDGIDNDGNGYIDDVHGWNFYASSSYGPWDNSYSSEDTSRFPNNGSSANGNNTYYNANSSTEDSHGTHCAGTIAAGNNELGVVGIASNANVKIMTVKVLGGSDGTGSTESVVKGITYAIDNGANIINLSLGGEEDDTALRNVIAENPNVLFTIAAGNGDSSYNGSDNDSVPTYPANYVYDNVLSVANLQCDGTLHYSSNYGATTVQLAAPGSYIYSTSTENDETDTSTDSGSGYGFGYTSSPAVSGYQTMTGTSMAAPMVAGVAAMLYSKYDAYSMLDIKSAILASVEKLDSLDGKISTGGMLNAGQAVAYLEAGKQTISTPVPTVEATATAVPTPTATFSFPWNRPSVTSTPGAVTPTSDVTGGTTAGPVVTQSPGSDADRDSTMPPRRTARPSYTTPVSNTTVPGNTSAPTNTDNPNTGNSTGNTGGELTSNPAGPTANTNAGTNTNTSAGTNAGDTKATAAPSANATTAPSAAGQNNAGQSGSTEKLEISAVDCSADTLTLGKSCTITVKAKGGTGAYTYDFFLSNGKEQVSNSGTEASMQWTPKKSGSWMLVVYVKDSNGATCNQMRTLTVSPIKLSLTKSKTWKKGATVKVTAKPSLGITPYKYRFMIYRNGKKQKQQISSKNYVNYRISRRGTYKIKVTVTDASGNTATKTYMKKI